MAFFCAFAPRAISIPFPLQQSTTPGPSDFAEVSEQIRGLIAQGKLDEAASLLSPIPGNNSKAAGLHAELGKAYYHQRQFQKAIPHFRSAYQQNPEDGETAQLLGLCLYSVGRYQEAILPLEKTGSRVGHGEIDAPYLLGICYLKTQQWEKAREAFARLFQNSAASPVGYLMLGKMMVREDLEDRAIPELQKALDLDPRLPMVHFLLGEIYLHQSKPQLGLAEFVKELEINPTVWLVYWRLGDAYARLGRYDEAEKVLKQSIWLNETFTGPYILLGQIQIKKGDVELGIGFLEQALKLDPRNYYAHYSLARAYQRLGRTSEAQKHFEMTQSLRSEQERGEDLLLLDPGTKK